MDIQVQGKKAFAATGGRAHVPDQPCLVFVHGAAMDHTIFALQARYFAFHGYNVLAVDMPGHGHTDGPLIPTISGMADWLSDLLDSLEIKSAAIAGHSMGALAALDFAGRYPEKTDKLALMGVSNPMPVGPPLLAAAQANDHSAYDMINIFGLAKRAQLGGNPTPGLWMSGGALRLMERSGPGVLFSDFSACNDYQGGDAAVAGIKADCVVIIGTEDRMTAPKSAHALAKQIGNAQVAVIKGSGHMMMIEAPDDVVAALRTIL